jgi:RimJ/RimL family protein N-acetyltransferase
LKIELRSAHEADLEVFFQHQLDPEANIMAAFTVKNPSDWQRFSDHWLKILSDPLIVIKTILVDGQIAGHVLCYGKEFGRSEVSYWLGRQFWGQGVATSALAQFLEKYEQRPLFARAASDNFGSIRVLEKCGFRLIKTVQGFSTARGKEIEEVLLILE